MKATVRLLIALSILAIASTFAVAQAPTHTEHQDKPADKAKSSSPQNHDGHHGGLNQRGDQAMGFSHEKTTHHFRLKADGGAIEVEANAADDITNRDQIRTHLNHITKKKCRWRFRRADVHSFANTARRARHEAIERRDQVSV